MQAEHDRLQNGGDDAAFKAVAETLIETNEELIRLNAALGKAETETARAKAGAEEQARIRREAEEKRKAAAAEEPTEDQQKRKNGESRPKKQKNDAVVKPVEGLRAERIRQIGEFGGMTKRQRTALKTLAITAGAIHTGDVYIFRSKLQDGQYVFADDIPGFPQYTAGTPAQNGFFDPNTGAIYIDLNAGQNGQGAILWTAGHELTHFIQKWSPTHYNILSEFLAETYGEAELNVLIDNQIEKAKGNGRTLTRAQAQAEVVADAMQTMFTDGDLLEKVVRLANRDKGLVGKIRVFLAKMAQRVISFAHNGLVHEADEARLLIEKSADLERLANVFAEGLQKAGEDFSKNQYGISQNGQTEPVQASFRGRKAQNHDEGPLRKAEQMEKNGADPEEIRKTTGWFRGMDHKWRFEIDDSKMRVDLTGALIDERVKQFVELENRLLYGSATKEDIRRLQSMAPEIKRRKPQTLGELIDHEDLFNAYPQLKEVNVAFIEMAGEAAYDPIMNAISINSSLMGSGLLGGTKIRPYRPGIPYGCRRETPNYGNRKRNQRNVRSIPRQRIQRDLEASVVG